MMFKDYIIWKSVLKKINSFKIISKSQECIIFKSNEFPNYLLYLWKNHKVSSIHSTNDLKCIASWANSIISKRIYKKLLNESC